MKKLLLLLLLLLSSSYSYVYINRATVKNEAIAITNFLEKNTTIRRAYCIFDYKESRCGNLNCKEKIYECQVVHTDESRIKYLYDFNYGKPCKYYGQSRGYLRYIRH